MGLELVAKWMGWPWIDLDGGLGVAEWQELWDDSQYTEEDVRLIVRMAVRRSRTNP